MADPDDTTKRCSCCGERKGPDEFNRSRDKVDGLQPFCRPCSNAARNAWKKANPERVKAYNAAWDKANLDRSRPIKAAWRKANPEKLLKNKGWWAAHPELQHAKNVAYRSAHPEKNSVYINRYRALKMGALGSHSATDITDIRRSQKDKCAACAISLRGKGAVDHIVALSKGGSNYRRNLQLLCKSCNSTKSARDAIEFMQTRGFLL